MTRQGGEGEGEDGGVEEVRSSRRRVSERVWAVVVGMQQYVGSSSSKKPATDGRSDETELEFPLAGWALFRRTSPATALAFNESEASWCARSRVSAVRHVDWTTVSL